ncbi:hypothetical protein GZ77_26290 [Endozoicomonas montiporae]|uniref:Uncharacterized protein n=1 Tax=Endozoicomonas montiporae TaxID=1027273 RepID=A0A081MYJ0_9GAMM|nr:hypothetical protein [Endozoicomonas montiporae]KEQ11263.1 hypothetical protein GZ77_26290 [Endozoicomonas montiporae]
MSKFKNAKSKLGDQKPVTKPEGVVPAQKTSATPKSFRLSGDDIANLKQITQAVNGVSRSKVSETKVVKALLQLGSQLPPEKVLKALREIL